MVDKVQALAEKDVSFKNGDENRYAEAILAGWGVAEPHDKIKST